ncbi:DUF2156 domain-containing protein [Chondromyces crocatus]|uniref:Phosphatidylglycerol lysyltransferase C-terminal domain-containing protein n=1 Tax=Chondromyces crocatus TaxID=52 RepID=A0A0K1ETY4_CHOCO|nr:DUF2156 domain-containing protein [Chondromyces crocatus]AKT44078.1 uncharacterized protein CMC5_083160 [Chondromyces crocatus]
MAHAHEEPPDSPRVRAASLLRRHGWNATSPQVLEGGFSYWFDGDDACVAYVDTGGAWVAAGAPLASTERRLAVTEHFIAAARAQGRRACFFATETRFAGEVPLVSLQMGEQPVWDPAAWEAKSLRSSRSLREQLRRARAKGVRVRQVSSTEVADPATPLGQGVAALASQWLEGRDMAPMGFLVQLDLSTLPEERLCLVAELDGALVGLLAAVPVYARNGWLIEDLLRNSGAPNGAIELLVDDAMRRFCRAGSEFATLGLAPLSGDVSPWLRAARKLGSGLYDFHGLHAFKAKLRPHAWVPIFLSFPQQQNSLLTTLDVLRAFAQGGLVRFGLLTLIRAPGIVIRLMALLLVPWTVLLALPLARPYFPTPGVRWAWVAFDVMVAIGLFSLMRRFRRSLALLIASAVTGDAVLTLAQALLWNMGRASGMVDALVITVAVAAPWLAALLLWQAIRRARL